MSKISGIIHRPGHGWLGVLLLAAMAGCCARRWEGARITVPAAPPAAGVEAGPSVLRILSWNVWLMPPWTLTSPGNSDRAAAIAAALKPLDLDILCLQKMFDRDARAVLMDALIERYPYQYGPANVDCSFNLTSGVVVLSRIPLSGYRETTFKRAAGIERFSNKGAMLLAGRIGAHPFQLVSTHLQGDDVPAFVPEKQVIRNEQMAQINDELIKPYADPSMPLFLCGDLNTPRYGDPTRRDPRHLVEGPDYRRMLALFGAENGPAYRITMDDARAHNDIAPDNQGRTEEFDYVLVRKGGADITGVWERLILRHPGWAGGGDRRQDLSYHWATKATFTFR